MATVEQKMLELTESASEVCWAVAPHGAGVLQALALVASSSTLIVVPKVYHRSLPVTQAEVVNVESLHWVNFQERFQRKDARFDTVVIHPGSIPRTTTAKGWAKLVGAVTGKRIVLLRKFGF
jgi:hypothetical protein